MGFLVIFEFLSFCFYLTVIIKSYHTIKITLIVTKMVHGMTILMFSLLVTASQFFENEKNGILKNAALYIIQASLYLEYIFVTLILVVNLITFVLLFKKGIKIENKLTQIIFYKQKLPKKNSLQQLIKKNSQNRNFGKKVKRGSIRAGKNSPMGKLKVSLFKNTDEKKKNRKSRFSLRISKPEELNRIATLDTAGIKKKQKPSAFKKHSKLQ